MLIGRVVHTFRPVRKGRVDALFAPEPGADLHPVILAYRESLRQMYLAASDALVRGGSAQSLEALTQDSRSLSRRYLDAVRDDLGVGRSGG